MSQKAVREHDGKRLLSTWMSEHAVNPAARFLHVNPETNLNDSLQSHSWLETEKLVVKPDQLIKRRGKAGLLGINLTWDETQQWINERRGKEVQVEKVVGQLDYFLVEPFIAHDQSDEYYVALVSNRDGDEILFYHEGGIDIGDVDSKARRLFIASTETPTNEDIIEKLLKKVPKDRRDQLAVYLFNLFEFYTTLHFTYLEINPLVMVTSKGSSTIYALDLAAKLDEAAHYECNKFWGDLVFPPPFGKKATPEEQYIADLDAKTGASLKLTILNPKGRIWTMVAGGGASVIYADTITDLGFGHELANYGEYSGAPSESLTYQYAKTILKLMTTNDYKHSEGKVLIIGGGIANFTNVAETFKGIIRALSEFKQRLIEYGVKVYVRRGGPNFQEGLALMRELGRTLGVPIQVYGPESNMTSIVSMALGKEVVQMSKRTEFEPKSSQEFLAVPISNGTNNGTSTSHSRSPSVQSENGTQTQQRRSVVDFNESDYDVSDSESDTKLREKPSNDGTSDKTSLFSESTSAIVYGMQPRAVQNMLDFDFMCRRATPSVPCIVYPFASGMHYRQFYWSSKEIMVPVYPSLSKALEKFPEVDVVVNFASSRSAYESTLEILRHPQIRTVAIIAEGVPERHTRHLLRESKAKNVAIIGPATVGGIKPGSFRIGNTGGMLDNIVESKLYRAGSVGYVARSGGLSNELNNIISRVTDGVFEGVAIGGDRYPISSYMDFLLRYEGSDECKMFVLLGEVGGTLEYQVCEALRSGKLTKPMVAWCTGTCAKVFPYEVQFGHAGALAQAQEETASAKNDALRKAGAYVPDNFEQFAELIRTVYDAEVEANRLLPRPEVVPPKIPVDYSWARKLGLIRKPTMFVSSIVDERGDELCYSGVPITQIFKNEMGIGGVLGLLWFRRKLPAYGSKFIEMVLMITADHGPAVSGAHNTIITTRAGKDLISSLVSGLLTIGPRFGGALDGAAQRFSWAYDKGLSPVQFVKTMRSRKELILGIGHKVKSVENPDKRVTIVIDFCKKHFKSTKILDYALEVEKVTTRKKSNLILNVDGAIGVAFVDFLRSCGLFSAEEAQEYIEMGALNGLFVLGRSMGFIGHHLDQKRLKQGLYRHPTDDIAYMVDKIH
uniref:ATP-citrate synthase n=3 Tax=Hirondellea gigas TaxID=1518452 RepID=A0A6A7FXX1_9CRUS